jgi:hypothetical protein
MVMFAGTPIIDMISSKFEARALECDHDLLVWGDLYGDSIGDGDSRKIVGGRVNHHRFDFFPYVEFVRAITPIDVLLRGFGETPTSPFRIPTAHRL